MQTGLSDLRSSGHEFTWWDNCIASPTYKKLDRCLVNGDWLLKLSLSQVQVLSRGLSGHCPLAISLGMCIKKVYRPFQFFLHLLDSPKFLHEVDEAWNVATKGNPWYALTTKLKRVEEAMRKLNSSRGNLHSQVDVARSNLYLLQNSLPQVPSVAQLDEESILCKRLKDALSSKEIFLKQKARVTWLKNGDNNNKYFFNACKGRWNMNKLLYLEDLNGSAYTAHRDIAKVAVDFYQTLMGSEKHVDPFPENMHLPQVSNSKKNSMSALFIEADVYHTFKKMAKNKCPGPDGFPTEFYLATVLLNAQ